jgi:hypothetical protein
VQYSKHGGARWLNSYKNIYKFGCHADIVSEKNGNLFSIVNEENW